MLSKSLSVQINVVADIHISLGKSEAKDQEIQIEVVERVDQLVQARSAAQQNNKTKQKKNENKQTNKKLEVGSQL